ncbi:MAG: DUF1080 domain-containing protein [Armatimonadetes bacterium]|nr:DUF1080 domain-containing protein [Armatimonadota bacterium]
MRSLSSIGLVFSGLAALALPCCAWAAGAKEAGPDAASKGQPEKVLFSGKTDDPARLWVRAGSKEPAAWKMEKGALVSGGGDIETREHFQDFKLHIEFQTPSMPNARGQAKGNSGVFLQGMYEIQVLDSYGIPVLGTGDCGALYSLAAPLVNACRPPKVWQTYDIIFRAARFEEGTRRVLARPRVTVLHNGLVIHNNVEIQGPTYAGGQGDLAEQGPVRLQDHGNRVFYRNIRITPLPPEGAKFYEYSRPQH